MWCRPGYRAPPGQGLLRDETGPHTGWMAPNPSAGRRMPRWSVRSRILATMLAVTALAMVGVGGVTFLVQRDRVVSAVDARLTDHVAAASNVVTGASGAQDLSGGSTGATSSLYTTTSSALAAITSAVLPAANESSIAVLDGEPAYVPGVDVPFRLEDDPALLARIVAEVSDGTVRLGAAATPIRHLRYIAIPVAVGDGSSGVFIAAVDVDAELSELTGSFVTFALIGLLALIAIGVAGWFVAGRLLEPLRRLRVAAAHITATDRHQRIPVVGNDDVTDLTRTVNDMLDRLDSALTGQQQLLDDVRHELKTPITIVRGHLELLDPSDRYDVEQTRNLAIDELDRMTGLVDDIAALAESRSSELRRVEVRADALTADVLNKARVIRGHEWVLGETSAARVGLDVGKITQAWLQLVDNAAKYAPEGTPITIGSTGRPDTVELWVRDVGPGIPADARDRIFERFGRADTGRGIHGSGLGLSIVRAIATAHGGRVMVLSSAQGTQIGLELPRYAEVGGR